MEFGQDDLYAPAQSETDHDETDPLSYPMKPSFVVLTLCYTGLIFLGAITPSDAKTAAGLLPDIQPQVANLLHTPAYGLLAWLWIVSLRSFGMVRSQAIRVAVTMATCCGIVTELAQVFVPGRYPSVEDVFFDIAGIAMFTGCYLMVSASRLNHLLMTRVSQ